MNIVNVTTQFKLLIILLRYVICDSQNLNLNNYFKFGLKVVDVKFFWENVVCTLYFVQVFMEIKIKKQVILSAKSNYPGVSLLRIQYSSYHIKMQIFRTWFD